MTNKIAKNQPSSIEEVIKQPNQSVIDHLEAALKDAKTGKLQAIATVRYWNDAYTSNGWAGLDMNPRLILAETVIMQQLMADHYVQLEKEDMGDA